MKRSKRPKHAKNSSVPSKSATLGRGAQKARIRKLRKQLLMPESDPHDNSPDRNLDAEEYLLRHLATVDDEPTTTNARQLIADGIELPQPDSLRPEEVHDKVWEVIRGLARRRTFLNFTNHLSDLELYRKLWKDTLNQATDDLDESMGNCACYVDLVDPVGDPQIYFKYYGDEFDRDMWVEDGPDDELPAHQDPPYDRDRHLPKR